MTRFICRSFAFRFAFLVGAVLEIVAVSSFALFSQESERWLFFRGTDQNPVRRDARLSPDWKRADEAISRSEYSTEIDSKGTVSSAINSLETDSSEADSLETASSETVSSRSRSSNSIERKAASKKANQFSWAELENNGRLKWTVRLPGIGGASSPIVVAGRVFVTSASELAKKRLFISAFDLETGTPLWERSLTATGSFITNAFCSAATSSPAGDGERVVALFSSVDLACFDLNGDLLWIRGLAYDFPKLRNDAATSSSPLIVGDFVIVQCQCQGESFIAALNKFNGETVWSIERPKSAIWSSPTIFAVSDDFWNDFVADRDSVSENRGRSGDDLSLPKPCFILAVDRSRLSFLDPRDGREVAFYEAACNTIASPVAVDGIVYLQGNGIHAIDSTPLLNLFWQNENKRKNETFSADSTGSSVSVDLDDSKNSDVFGDPAADRFSTVDSRKNGERDGTTKEKTPLDENVGVEPLELSSIWIEEKLRCDNPSPIVDSAAQALYVVKQPGVLIAADLESGEILWQSRLQGPFWATPVVVGDRLAAVNQGGLLQIVELSDSRPRLDVSVDLEEKTLATPVVLQDGLLLRSDSRLFRIQ